MSTNGKNYNPRDLGLYLGKMYRLSDGSRFQVDQEGNITGLPSLEGATLSMMGGISTETYQENELLLTGYPVDHALAHLVLVAYGKPAQRGMRLMVVGMNTEKEGVAITPPLEDILHAPPPLPIRATQPHLIVDGDRTPHS